MLLLCFFVSTKPRILFFLNFTFDLNKMFSLGKKNNNWTLIQSMYSRNACLEAAIYSPLIPGTNKVSKLHREFHTVYTGTVFQVYTTC